MLKALTKTGVFALAQGSDHCFNFIHVRDVALATERALIAPGPVAPLAYNISSGEYWQLGDVAALVRPMFPAGRLQIGPGPVAASRRFRHSTAIIPTPWRRDRRTRRPILWRCGRRRSRRARGHGVRRGRAQRAFRGRPLARFQAGDLGGFFSVEKNSGPKATQEALLDGL
jgi:nucleoside-diphosphate-sugar epimerase